MSTCWFEAVRKCVYDATGVCVDKDKQYLAHARLTPLLDAFAAGDLPELARRAASLREPALRQRVVEAMMTGETSFFRDQQCFDYLATTILPDVRARNEANRQLRIWCAACSSGQEAYSVAMILDTMRTDLHGWRVDTLATDASASAIEKAAAGLYNQFEVQRGLPVNMLLRHFTRDQGRWRISERLRTRLRFATQNLLVPQTAAAPFDIIYCRNVLMYFDQKTRRKALENLDSVLAQGGWLVLGSTETAILRDRAYTSAGSFPAIYRKSASGGWQEESARPEQRAGASTAR